MSRGTIIAVLVILFTCFLSIFGYLFIQRLKREADEKKRIEDWENKVNGDEVFFFTECKYRGFMISEKITNPMSSMYDQDDMTGPLTSMIIPKGVEVKAFTDDNNNISFTYTGPRVLRCITAHDPVKSVHITHV
jgi:hypothetical protein